MTDHRHDHGHEHSHGSIRAGERHKGRLAVAFAVLAVFMVVEVVAGFVTGSLALLSDAGHMLTDVLGLGMALAAIHLASRGGAHPQPHLRALPARDPRRPGQRGAAVRRGRLRARRGGPPLRRPARRGRRRRCSWSPSLGLAANLVAFALLREGAKERLNVEGAYLEVLADTVGSVGVIVGAVVMRATGWDVGRPRRRRGHRPVDPAPHVAPRRARRCASSCRPRPPGIDLGAMSGRPRRPRRRRRRPRPPRLDAHHRHGGRLGPPDGRAGHRHATACSTRPATLLAGRLRHRPRHPPGRARRPRGLRRGELVRAIAGGPGPT